MIRTILAGLAVWAVLSVPISLAVGRWLKSRQINPTSDPAAALTPAPSAEEEDAVV